MSELFAMGNYGVFVWSSFGLTLIVLLVCIAQGNWHHAAVLRDIKTRIRAMELDK